MVRSANDFWPFWVVAVVMAAAHPGIAVELRAVAGKWEPTGGSDWVLRDALTRRPVALVEDAFGRLAVGGSGVIQGALDSNLEGLGILTVYDVSPEFWAQPSVWNTFQRGPSGFAGFGRDAGPREWAGRPAFDRRADALDPGWQVVGNSSAPVSAPATSLGIQANPGSLVLHWPAPRGHLYVIESAPSLDQPFQPFKTFGSVAEGEISVVLPTDSQQGYYRVTEYVY